MKIPANRPSTEPTVDKVTSLPTYQLLDFGQGRKREWIAGRTIDRPCPVATDIAPRQHPWPAADARFQPGAHHQGRWIYSRPWPATWLAPFRFGNLQLQCTPFGHTGLFAEQIANWEWMGQAGNRLAGLNLLNLFAYTGGSTLAALAGGASVTHVDSARNTVARARENAQVSNLADRPVRWIVEDVCRFVQREIRRGNHYDGVILDPPTRGQGVSRGQIWKISQGLPALLRDLARLVPDCRFMLCTCHTSGFDAGLLAREVERFFPVPGHAEQFDMQLMCSDGRRLPAGHGLRWIPELGHN